MAAGSLVKEFCEEMTCSICLEYFKEPVTIDCGHNFCQACLTRCWAESHRGPSCPQCREVFQQKNFRPNRQLGNLVELVKKLQARKDIEGKRGGCKKHQEPLKLFCVNDQAPICVVCDRSMVHQNHRVLPMEEAFLEYKKEIQVELQSLEQERRKLQEQKMADDQRSQKNWAQLQVEKTKTNSAFLKVHNYLVKEEYFRRSILATIENKMARRNRENHARFLEEVSHLNRLIAKMEKKLQLSEHEFLQDPKTILSRYMKDPERQLLEPPLELEEALRTYSKRRSALRRALARCQGFMEKALSEGSLNSSAVCKVNVPLEPGKTHQGVIQPKEAGPKTKKGNRERKRVGSVAGGKLP